MSRYLDCAKHVSTPKCKDAQIQLGQGKAFYLCCVEGGIGIEALHFLRSVKHRCCILHGSDLLAAKQLDSFYSGELCEGQGSSCIKKITLLKYFTQLHGQRLVLC